MRIHLKNVSPKVHGMITEHKASHGHDNLDKTVSCLIEEAMKRFDEADKIEDLNALLKRYMLGNDKLRHDVNELKDRLINDMLEFNKLPTTHLKLFVWEGFNPDYSAGLAFAIAETEEEAKNMIIKRGGREPSDGWGTLSILPINKFAFFVDGGG